MSLFAALNASVAGLRAQSAAIAAVSENIANTSTTAYKTREVSFQSLVTSTNTVSSSNQIGGGVVYSSTQDLSSQGSIEVTSTVTNLAIEGSGFFVVSDDTEATTSGYMYTRNGNFSSDENGLLVNDEGVYLYGYPVDDEGNITASNSTDLSSLELIDIGSVSGTAQATTAVEFDMNLPADAEVGDTFTTSFEVYDELGVSHTVVQTWEKTDANTWEATFDDPYQTSLGSGSTATGSIDLSSVGGNPVEFVFNGDGTLSTIGGAAADAFDVSITGLSTTTGADDVTFSLDLGTADESDGLTQFASDSDTPDINISSIEQDGVRFGQLSGVDIDDDGLVTAVFDNGVRLPIYQVAIATFSNPAGLTNVSGTIYDENENAGNYVLNVPGEGNAGTVHSSSLEVSTTDSSTEFNKMIVAQQAYSSNAQVLSAVDEMFDTLLTAVR